MENTFNLEFTFIGYTLMAHRALVEVVAILNYFFTDQVIV